MGAAEEPTNAVTDTKPDAAPAIDGFIKGFLPPDVVTADPNASPPFEYKVHEVKSAKTVWEVAFWTFIILAFDIFPFAVYPVVVLALIVYFTLQYGIIVLAAFFTLCAISLSVPPWYTRLYRTGFRVVYSAFKDYAKSFKIILPTKAYDAERGYIFACHPHGRMFYSYSLFMETWDIWMAKENLLPPEKDVRGTAASAVFTIPFLRNWLYILGIIPADKKGLTKALKKGISVGIIIGGIREITLGATEDEDRLYLKRRLGFCRLAIETNSGIVPSYFFGENEVFKHDPQWELDFFRWLNKYAPVGVPLMRGVFNLPIPFRRDLVTIVGEPLYPQPGETPEALLLRYTEELKKLFRYFVLKSDNPKRRMLIF